MAGTGVLTLLHLVEHGLDVGEVAILDGVPVFIVDLGLVRRRNRGFTPHYSARRRCLLLH